MLKLYKGKIVELQLPTVKSIGNNFLYYNKSLLAISLPKVTSIGNRFLYYNDRINKKDYDKY